ncbi:metalloprotease [Candidatus Woesearchaeota archaeon]|nr:MAG: metalloprotease [Candidatus Woesearchaeota archaeon]
MKPVHAKITTSKQEITDLLIAWVIVSLAFGIVIRPLGISIFSNGAIKYILIAAFTVGIGFLLHELAHKVVAQRYRCWAEFRADYTMLFLALIMSFFGFVFAAPGAVMIFGNVTKRQNGLISIAGPLTNIVLALLFIPFLFIPFSHEIATYGFMINAFIALFNMIPFGFFDGAKIIKWSKVAYFATVAVALGLTVLSFMVR